MLTDRIGEMPPWTIFLAPLLAPLAVWILWRLQIVSVEILRRRMVKLVRYGLTPVYNVISWFGTLLHEISHATVLLLSGHGIKQFKVGVEQGHVLPRRMQRGPVGFLFFLVAALAPLFGPPTLALVLLALFIDTTLWPFVVPATGLHGALVGLEATLVTFPWKLLQAVVNIDVANPWHAAAFFVILAGIPGSRPSHIKGSRFHSKDDEGDIAVVRKKIRKQPWPLLAFLVLIIAAYYPLSKWLPAAYWYPFQAVWAVALTAIVLSLFGAVWWSLVALSGRIKLVAAWIPITTFVVVQVLARAPGTTWPIWATNMVSLVGLFATSIALMVILPRRKKLPKRARKAMKE